jgi:chlorite dismutase
MAEQRFVQFLVFKLDPLWRRLPEEERRRGRAEFASAIESPSSHTTTYSYSLVGLQEGADLLLWRSSASLEALQETASQLLQTSLGRYLDITHSLLGLTRPSVYVRKPDSQEQAVFSLERSRYLIIYPFTKTAEWYLLSKEARQGLMNEHIRVGKGFQSIRQVLVYSFGVDDQEFIVAYETDDLAAFQDLVMALRETEARRYTQKDTPIFTGIYRPLTQALALLG